MPQTISEEDVRRVAKLSRLELSDEQVHAFTGQLAHVLDYISKLNELNVDDVEPMAHAVDITNVLRDDAVQEPLAVEVALANAPQAAELYFRVPKVLGEGSGA